MAELICGIPPQERIAIRERITGGLLRYSFAIRYSLLAIRSTPAQHVGDPVPHVVHGDGDVVDLAVVEATFLALEYFQRLLLRADGGETFFCDCQRDLLVAGAV